MDSPLYFYDANRGAMKLENWGGDLWLFYKHPDGQWVSYRKATEDDLRVLGQPAPTRPVSP